MTKDLLVSVCVIAYNQEKFIGEALDSIFSQNTNFNFEIVVSDDCSTDKTRQIIDSYHSNINDKIIFRTIHSKSNLGYKKNFRKVLEAARGRYIAICEGDDYWTDSFKLNKQLKQLENNSNCVISFHNVSILNHISKSIILSNNEVNGTIYYMTDIVDNWTAMTSSLMFKNESIIFPDWFDIVFNTDYALQLILLSKGRGLIYSDDVMSVYRKHSDGISNSTWGSSSILWLIYLFTKLNEFTKGSYSSIIRNKIIKLEMQLISNYAHEFKIINTKVTFFKIFHYYLKRFFVKLSMSKIYLRGFMKSHNLR